MCQLHNYVDNYKIEGQGYIIGMHTCNCFNDSTFSVT